MKASHFLVRQESGKEVSALAGLRPSFRFQRNRAGRSHAARVLLRAQNSLRSFRGPARKPGPCRACVRHFAFSETGQAVRPLYASLRWFRTSERQKLWHFSNAHETARMTFVCSHPTDASKNDIGNRAGRDGVSGPHTGQHFAPRACGKAAAQK